MNYNNIESIELPNELLIIKDVLINNIKKSCKIHQFKFFEYLKNKNHNFKIISNNNTIFHIHFNFHKSEIIYFSFKAYMLLEDKLI